MYRLCLIRHAKSSWKLETPDRYRPLNQRGIDSIQEVAAQLKALDIIPDAVVTSPAVRAYSTALHMSDLLGADVSRLNIDDSLYEASSDEFLSLIEKLSPLPVVFVVGHDPAISAAVARLSGKPVEKFPTCAVAIFEKDEKSTGWRLKQFVKPAKAAEEKKEV